MRYLILILILCATGCSAITIKKGDVSFTRTSFGVNLEVPKLTFKQSADGVYSLTVSGVNMNETDTIQAAVQGAVQGMAASAKP